MATMGANLFILVGLVTILQCNAEHLDVLFLSPLSTKSHKNFYSEIVKSLAEKGHRVTFVTPFAGKKITNVKEILTPAGDFTKFSPNLFNETGIANYPIQQYLEIMPGMCSDALESNQIQNLFTKKIDVILLTVVFSDCLLLFKHRFKEAPLIYVTPGGLDMGGRTVVGNPSFPSYSPSLITSFGDQMSFTERLINTLAETILSAVLDYIFIPRTETIARRRGLLPDDMASLYEMHHNASFLIVNAIRSIEPPRAVLPNVVYAGGIHIKPAKPLSEELENWVNGSGDSGFVFFSLGSMFRSGDLPDSYRKMLLNVFKSLKQRVLWKWEDEMSDLPPNVKISKWLPQQDLLGHPKIRLFITHGGLHSVMETIYHGVPSIGIPIFGDQKSNLRRLERDGLGKMRIWKNLTEQNLKLTIENLLNDTTMRKLLQQKAAIMKDQLATPSSVVAYWVEYAVRHNGAHHLRTPARLFPVWKIYNMDVWAVLITVVVIIFYILFISCSWLGRKCLRGIKYKLD